MFTSKPAASSNGIVRPAQPPQQPAASAAPPQQSAAAGGSPAVPQPAVAVAVAVAAAAAAGLSGTSAVSAAAAAAVAAATAAIAKAKAIAALTAPAAKSVKYVPIAITRATVGTTVVAATISVAAAVAAAVAVVVPCLVPASRAPPLRNSMSVDDRALIAFDPNQPTAFAKDAIYLLDMKCVEQLSSLPANDPSACFPYLKLWVDGGTSCVRSSIRDRTTQPMWTDARDTQSFVFPLSAEQSAHTAWNGVASLNIEVWDDNRSQMIGHGRLPLSLGTIAPYIRFARWSRAEEFIVLLWEPNTNPPKRAGSMSVRISHVSRDNYVNRWIKNYYGRVLYCPLNQRTTSNTPFYSLSVTEQPSILIELLKNVTHWLVRNWLVAPSSVHANQCIVTDLLNLHGGVMQTESETAALNAATAGTASAVAAAVAASKIASPEQKSKKPTPATTSALSASRSPSPPKLPTLAEPAVAAAPVATASSAGSPGASSRAGTATTITTTNTNTGGAGVGVGAGAVSGSAVHAAQRDPNSPLVKQLTSVLTYLFGLLSVEHSGSTLMYGNRVPHEIVPFTAVQIRQNTICYVSFLSRVVAGGGWESMLNADCWAGSVVSMSWALVFGVPAFDRVDWNDAKNDDTCQSLLDSVSQLIKHTHCKHSLVATGEMDEHTDCFGVNTLKTTFGDPAESNPLADRVRRVTRSFSKFDKSLATLHAHARAAGEESKSDSATSGSNSSSGSSTTPAGGDDYGFAIATAPVLTHDVTFGTHHTSNGEAALQATLRAVNTDGGSTTPIGSIDDAKRIVYRLRAYNSPEKMFVAGGLERSAIANALDSLFKTDRSYIESQLRMQAAAAATGNRARIGGALARTFGTAVVSACQLLQQRMWFEGEMAIAEWVVSTVCDMPFVDSICFPLTESLVRVEDSEHCHNPFLVLNVKRFVPINGFINYLVSLPPDNLAAVITTHRQIRNLSQLASFENLVTADDVLYPNSLQWKSLFWRAAMIVKRTRDGHISKSTALTGTCDCTVPCNAGSRAPSQQQQQQQQQSASQQQPQPAQQTAPQQPPQAAAAAAAAAPQRATPLTGTTTGPGAAALPIIMKLGAKPHTFPEIVVPVPISIYL